MVRRAQQPGFSATQVAQEFHTSTHTVLKWNNRFEKEGLAGLEDSSSRPVSRHPRALTNRQVRQTSLLRKHRRTMERIARNVGSTPPQCLRTADDSV